MTSINGKYILLTGGSRGIGPIIAEALAARGAHLALAARSEEGLKAVASNLSKYGTQTMIVPVDLSQTFPTTVSCRNCHEQLRQN